MAIRALPRAILLAGIAILATACSNGRGSVAESSAGESPTLYRVTTNVSGLEGAGLILRNNGADEVTITANGSTRFATRLPDGAAYAVTIESQPIEPEQTCTIASGSGRIAGGDAVIDVICATAIEERYLVGGTVTGLTGSGLVLDNGAGEALPIETDGEFAFNTSQPSGSSYSISVSVQPTNPSQVCTISNAAGLVGDTDVTNVNVTCAANSFALGGIVSGLSGSGLELQNGGAVLAVEGNGPFRFPERIADGVAYDVTVRTAPSSPRQSCSVANGAGTFAGSEVTDVVVTCTTDRFSVGGMISGLAGRGLVLESSGAGEVRPEASGPFQFPTTVPSGTPYLVTVSAQPNNPRQTCTVANGSGTVQDVNVTNVSVVCVTERFTIGGRVNGLAGSGLVLQVNGRNDLAIASNGNFIFDTTLASGTTYDVTVRTQPANPAQTCTIARGSGLVGSNNVTNIEITCATRTFALSGTVSGLLGSGLTLQNNGQNPVEVESNGAFQFGREFASGSAYNVTVRSQPANPTQACVVANGTGVITTADITTIAVTCTTSTFTVGGTVTGLAGSGLILRNNGVDELPLDANGGFAFGTPLPSGGAYNVTIAAQPTNPTQSCAVTNGSGAIGASNITNVGVTCTTTEYTIGGTVSGLNGSGLALQNNGGEILPIAANGPFVFASSATAGTPYDVTVVVQPANPAQVCSVANGSGSLSGVVTNIQVTCVDITYPLGGTGGGLGASGGNLILENNGADSLVLSSDGPFMFPTEIGSGASYSVTISVMPIDRLCNVANGQGIALSPVTDIIVTCTPMPLPP
jgi:hypothetical protein